jgi:cell wall-associated NlpC family hydrolase
MPRRLVGALSIAAVCVATALSLGSAPASADTPTDAARHRALALADQVTALELKAEIASEAYAASEAALGVIVQQQVQAQESLDKLTAVSRTESSSLREQVRTLYMSAGNVSLLPGLLRGSSPQDVLSQLDTVQRVLAHQAKVADGVQLRLATVQSSNTRLQRLADQRTALTTKADDAQVAVEALLEERQAALDAASKQVLDYEKADIRQREQRAEAEAAARLAAQNVAVSPLLPNPLPPASPLAAIAIASARAEVGKPYQYAGNGPDTFDCSGLTRWAYAAAGISLPRTSRQQWSIGPHIELKDLKPGDLLFWATDVNNPATIHHVALYVGAGWMIQAPHTGEVVQFSRVYLNGYIGATRPPGV